MIAREPTIERLATARQLLLEPFGLDESHLAQALAAIRAHQVDDADLYFQYTRAEGWSLEEGIVKTGSFSIDQGVGVRAVSGEKTAFAYSDDISLPSLLDAAHTVRAIASAGKSAKVRIPKTTIAPSRSLYPALDPIATLGSTDKVALLGKVEALARAQDPRIVQVMAGLASEYDVVLVARADGTLAADVRPLVRLSVTVIAEQGGRREVGSSGGGGRFGLAYFDDALIADYVGEAVRQALTNLDARPAPAGEMTVVLGAGWPGVLLHEAVGHGLEGDFNRKGSSAFSGRIGQRVAAKGVTVLDDGTISDRRGSLNVDDEGNTSQRNVLIEDGILKGYIQDSLNARLMGVAPTGNLPATLDGKPFRQAVMEPTRLYVKNVLAALAAHPIKALAHITGGGLLENIPRVLPEGTAAHLQKGSWPQTELFAWLQATAGIDDIEMNRTFNNGIGMVVVVDAANAEATAATLRATGEQVYTIGAIAPRGEGAAVVVA